METYKNLKKGTKIGLLTVAILTAIGFVNLIINIFTALSDAQPDSIGHMIMDAAMFSLIAVYAFVGYKKPHGNMLRMSLLLLGTFVFINGVIPVSGMDETRAILFRLFAGAATLLIGYISGRLDRIKKNLILMILVGVLLLAGQIIILSRLPAVHVGEVIGVLTPVTMWAALTIAYVARYEEHKAAGLADKADEEKGTPAL